MQFGPYCKPKQVVLVFSLAVVAMQCGSCHYLEGGLGIGDWCSFSLPIGVIDAVASLVEEWAGVVLTSCSLSLSIMFSRILNPAASNIRIYYPINKEEPTPALPKGGSLNEAQYSLTSNRLTSNGHYPPSLGERLRVGELCSGMGLGVGPRLRRICYPPEQIPPLLHPLG